MAPSVTATWKSPLTAALCAALAALLAGCGRSKTVETYPKGDPKLVRTYGWLGGEKPENLKRERAYYFNGKVERDARFKGGILHGTFTDYWHNGQKRSQGRYEKGKKQGEWEYYFNEYTLATKGLYQDDFKEGPWNQFWENGSLRSRSQFRGGAEVGTRKEWSAKGDLILENSCFAANDTGRYASFHANETPHEAYRCLRGKPAGPYERKDPDGSPIEKGVYDSLGRKQGPWESYHDDGTRASLTHYRDGEMADSALSWYAGGIVKERAYFQGGRGDLIGYDSLGRVAHRRALVNGKPEGEARAFYPDGKVKSVTVYRDGQPVAMRRWHANGRLASEGTFVKGRKSGAWRQLDAQGRLVETSHYEDGDLHGERVFYDSLGRPARTQRYEHGYPAEGKIPKRLGR